MIHYLRTVACFIFFVFCALRVNAADKPPNIIIVLVDDLGWSNLGSFGGVIETPNIDRLASEGIRFNQFYSEARCCPSRASLLTGLAPHQTGVGHMTFKRTGNMPSVISERMKVPFAYRGWVGENIPTLPEMLKKAGYNTYMAGKWHVGNSDTATWPKQRGFDRFYGFLEGTSEYFRPKELWRNNTAVKPEGKDFYTTDAFTNEAIAYLKDHENKHDDSPFFLYLAYNAPHFPMQAMPEDFKKYRGRFKQGWDVLRKKIIERQKEMGLIPKNTVLSDLPGKSERLGSKGGAVPQWSQLSAEVQDSMDAIMAVFAGMVDRVDQNVGKLIAHLKQTNELDNTLIFFLSDNGGEAESPVFGTFKMANLGKYGKGGSHYGRAWATFSNTPFREYKHFTHQGGIQTPLIVHWPDVMKKQSENMISGQYGNLTDIAATCLDVANAQRPGSLNGQPVPAGEGRSLKPILSGHTKKLHSEAIFSEHEGNCMVRKAEWKLVRFYGEPWELYNLDKDRTETTDLASQYPKMVSQLSSEFDNWAKRVGVIPWAEAKNYSVYPKGRFNF